MKLTLSIFALGALLVSVQAEAAMITSFGQVRALSHRSQIASVVGQADFDDSVGAVVEADSFAEDGMVIHGDRSGYGQYYAFFFREIESPGFAVLPRRLFNPSFSFPRPILGGAAQEGWAARNALAATFTVPVNQFGLTLSNVRRFITAWDATGQLIGSVLWEPVTRDDGVGLEAGFAGIDTGATSIAMIVVGGANIWEGGVQLAGGGAYDSLVWARRVAEPSSATHVVVALSGLGVTVAQSRQRRAVRTLDPRSVRRSSLLP